jgi:hypothetical protein
MSKKRTKYDKMSKKEKTSLAYALATNIAKYGRPQSPKNERKLSKGEMKTREKEVKKFKKAFDLEEIRDIMAAMALMRSKDEDKPKVSRDDKLPSNYNPRTGKFTEKLDPVGKEDADINNDGKVDKTDDYLRNRRKAISKAIKEGDLDLGHQDNEPHMLKKDLYRTAKYASELYVMVNNFDNDEVEVDFPHWWQSKIIKAKNMLISAKHYLDGELTIPQIDATIEQELNESLNPEVSQTLDRFIKAMAKKYEYSEQDAVFAIMAALKQMGFDGINEEMDINDPVLVQMRAARDRTNKMLSQPKPRAPKRKKDNSAKIAFLQKERERLMMDMEQEAEPEGGPIADRYGAELNRIDRAIAKLSGRQEMTYDQAIAEGKSLKKGDVVKFKDGSSIYILGPKGDGYDYKDGREKGYHPKEWFDMMISSGKAVVAEVKIGDELTMDDKDSPVFGKKGKVTKLTQDGVEVDFGGGDKYGIISRRIRDNKITA